MMETGDTFGLIKTIRNVGYSLAADVRRRRLGPAGLPSDTGEALAS
jgi:DNA-binding winged helix-turn-helix (wHTH) protein